MDLRFIYRILIEKAKNVGRAMIMLESMYLILILRQATVKPSATRE